MKHRNDHILEGSLAKGVINLSTPIILGLAMMIWYYRWQPEESGKSL